MIRDYEFYDGVGSSRIHTAKIAEQALQMAVNVPGYAQMTWKQQASVYEEIRSNLMHESMQMSA